MKTNPFAAGGSGLRAGFIAEPVARLAALIVKRELPLCTKMPGAVFILV